MNKNNYLEELDDIKFFVKNDAVTGGDLYDAFSNYQKLVLSIWPNDMPDNGNWRKEMSFVLSKIESKKHLKSIEKSVDLRSFRDDALDVIHHVNTNFLMYSLKV